MTRPASGSPGRWPRGISSRVLVVAAMLVAAGSDRARGQLMILAEPVSPAGEEAEARQGFMVPTDESLQTVFSDFERHSERKAWEKAFATLNEIPSDKRTGMLARPDGLIIPAQQRIWDSIASLPADGREAFRVFYDAKARQAWQPVAERTISGPAQIAAAEKVYQEWFLTSVGDNAADFLGDLAFERGEFAAAERYWQAILEKHPDSELPEERLQFKRGLALAKLGRAAAVGGIRRTIDQRFDSQPVKVGGEPVKPGEFLARVLSASEAPAAASTEALRTVKAPLPETQPEWRTQFVYGQLLTQFEQAATANYYYRNGMETLVAATTSDEERIYANWFGICFAIDLASGKLAWRSQKFSELAAQASNLPGSGSNLENYAIASGYGLVVATLLPIDRLNYWQEPFRLVCYEGATGKERWKTLDSEALNNVSFIGVPMIEADRILVLGHGREDSTVSLYSLDHQGKQQWVSPLGTARKHQSMRGNEVMPQPRMIRQGSSVVVATQDGALLSFDLEERKLQWMLTYPGPEQAQTTRFFYGGTVDAVTQLHTLTAISEYEGILYIKEAGSTQLIAIDPAIPSLVWKRPVEKAAQIVGIDHDAVYTLDTELSAIDRQTHALRWATRLPIASGGLSALIGPETIVVLTNRGLFELERSSGDMRRIFRGADIATLGGRLLRIGNRIIAVTTQSITCYRDPASTDLTSPAANPASATATPTSSPMEPAP